MRIWIAVLAAYIHSAAPLLADGKMYAREKVSTTIPYQRALILFDQGQQTLVLQSHYRIPGGTTGSDHPLGWVVPVPAPPDFATMPAQYADWLFHDLDMLAAPDVTLWRNHAIIGLFVGSIVIALGSQFLWFLARAAGKRSTLRRVSLASVIVAFATFLSAPMVIRQSKGPGGVEVIKSGKAGIYDVSVLKSETPGELIAWFNRNGFNFSPEDSESIRSHLKRNWCFVVARINPGLATRGGKLIDPLILHFPTPHPVYPTALTATSGSPTEILIYLMANDPMTTDSALVTKFRGAVQNPQVLLTRFLALDPVDFVERMPLELKHLHKFKATLTPAQMETDIGFRADPAACPYREHIKHW
jgi:hypothetical protein